MHTWLVELQSSISCGESSKTFNFISGADFMIVTIKIFPSFSWSHVDIPDLLIIYIVEIHMNIKIYKNKETNLFIICDIL